jgi:thioredoxin:protein disulfide reductase
MKPFEPNPPLNRAFGRRAMRALAVALALAPGFSGGALAAAEAELLDPEVAFQPSLRLKDPRTVEVLFTIAPGYYLYRDRFRFALDGQPLLYDKKRLPAGKWKQDATFGRVQTYRDSVRLLLPIAAPAKGAAVSATMRTFEVLSQGCADAGVCYPPQRQRFSLPREPGDAVGPLGQAESAGFSRPAEPSPGIGELLKRGK